MASDNAAPASNAPIDLFESKEGKTFYYADAMRDLGAALSMWRAWLLLGLRDFMLQTNRTLLGPAWGVVGTTATVVTIGWVYGSMAHFGSFNAFVFLAGGFIAWYFIAGCIQGGTNVFISAAGVLTERNIPIMFLIMRYFVRMTVEFFLKFSTYAIICAATAFNPGWNILYVFPAILIYLVNGVWVLTLFACVGARFRDAIQIISPLMLIMFLATPIMWPEATLITNKIFVQLNPFAYFIDILRDPMLGRIPSSEDYFVTIGFAVVGFPLAIAALARSKNRLVYWM
jgi:ABC-type polysaccharide/polyol phosphate export permease